MIWIISGHDPHTKQKLPALVIVADSFDEAIRKARIKNKWYNGGKTA